MKELLEKVLNWKMKEFSKGEQRKLKLANTISLSLGVICFPYIFLFYFLDLPFVAGIVAAYVFLYTSFPFLASLKKPDLSKHMLLIYSSSIIFFLSILMGRDSWVHLFYFVSAAQPFIFFETKQWRHLLFTFGLPIGLFITLELFVFGMISPIVTDADTQYLIFIASVPSAYLMIIVYVLYFKLSNERAEREIEQKKIDMQTMLQNLEQGIFVISKNQTIHREYSQFLEKILGTKEIAGQIFDKVLFSQCNLSREKIAEGEKCHSLFIGKSDAVLQGQSQAPS